MKAGAGVGDFAALFICFPSVLPMLVWASMLWKPSQALSLWPQSPYFKPEPKDMFSVACVILTRTVFFLNIWTGCVHLKIKIFYVKIQISDFCCKVESSGHTGTTSLHVYSKEAAPSLILTFGGAKVQKEPPVLLTQLPPTPPPTLGGASHTSPRTPWQHSEAVCNRPIKV